MDNRAYKVERVLAEFAAMGADDLELIRERKKLSDGEYLGTWYDFLVKDENILRWEYPIRSRGGEIRISWWRKLWINLTTW